MTNDTTSETTNGDGHAKQTFRLHTLTFEEAADMRYAYDKVCGNPMVSAWLPEDICGIIETLDHYEENWGFGGSCLPVIAWWGFLTATDDMRDTIETVINCRKRLEVCNHPGRIDLFKTMRLINDGFGASKRRHRVEFHDVSANSASPSSFTGLARGMGLRTGAVVSLGLALAFQHWSACPVDLYARSVNTVETFLAWAKSYNSLAMTVLVLDGDA